MKSTPLRFFSVLSMALMIGAVAHASPTAEGLCKDAGLTGKGFGQCVAYCSSGCTPDSRDKRCAKKRQRFFDASGQVAFPCDCQAAETDDEAFLAANPPPDPEPVVRAVLAVPPGVDPDTVGDLQFHPNGEHVIWSASLIGESGEHIMISRIDGSDFSCLTCPLGGLPYVKMDIFSDGRRIVVGNQVVLGLPGAMPYPSPFPGFEVVPILECTPNLLDCQTPELVFARVPFDPADPLVFSNQHVREFRIAPDGVHLAWTQARLDFFFAAVPVIGELRRESDHYALDNVEVLVRLESPFKPRPDGEGFDYSAPTGSEIKRFINGGTTIGGASAKTVAINRDAGSLDIANGTFQRLTNHPDYDEPFDLSPDGNWLVVGSKRSQDPAFDVLAAFGLVPRPNFIVLGGTQFLGVWGFQGNFGQNRGLDTWLVDRFGARGDYIGQRLSDDVCYGGRERQHWNADGTRVAKREQIRPVMASDPQCQGLPPRRLVVYELVSRAPVPPEDRPPVVPTPDAPWAAGITDPKTRPGNAPGLYVVPGSVFGEARVDLAEDGISVEYRDYSDDGLLVLNGVESFTRAPGSVSYPADIEVSGCRSGFFHSTAALNGLPVLQSSLAPLSGSASSELGSQSFEICEPGLIGVDTCP